MYGLDTKAKREAYLETQFAALISNGSVREDYKGLKIFTREQDGKFYLRVFKDTATTPVMNYYYGIEEKRTSAIDNVKAGYDATEKRRAEEKKNPRISTAANCATAIREELKIKFPGTKFSVRCSNFAGGNSVHVDYVDGPTTGRVEEVINKYQYGSFNGMQDIYEYTNTREDIPQAKYVSANRSKSAEVNNLEGALEKLIGTPTDTEYNNRPSQMLYRLFYKTDLEHCTVKGIERNPDITCGSFEDFYRIVVEKDESVILPAPKEQIAPMTIEAGTVQVIEYTDKSIAVVGDTKSIKTILRALGGKFNYHLSCGPGWIFKKADFHKVTAVLGAPQPLTEADKEVSNV